MQAMLKDLVKETSEPASPVAVLQEHDRASARMVCRVVGQHRSTQRDPGKVVSIKSTLPLESQGDEGAGGCTAVRVASPVSTKVTGQVGILLVHLYAVGGHVDDDIAALQQSDGELFLDHIVRVTTTDDEIIEMPLINLHLQDLPENGPAADVHHGLGLEVNFLANARPAPAGRNHFFPESDPEGETIAKTLQEPYRQQHPQAIHAKR